MNHWRRTAVRVRRLDDRGVAAAEKAARGAGGNGSADGDR
jgi:hypothetical protein